MAYRLKRAESVGKGVGRIAREEIGNAVQQLRGKSGVGLDEAVHEARKSMKKARALLRLVRPSLGVYTAENARLRDAGLKLFQLRDAGILVTAFDQLKSRSKSLDGRRSLAPIRHALALYKNRVEREPETRKSIEESAAILSQSLKSARRWTLETDGFPAMEDGLEKSFRDGKKALAVLKKSGLREDLHEWRKRVKDHWYHVRLLRSSGPT